VNSHGRDVITKRGASPVEILRTHHDTYPVVGKETRVEAALIVGNDDGVDALSDESGASHFGVSAGEVDPHGLKISHVFCAVGSRPDPLRLAALGTSPNVASLLGEETNGVPLTLDSRLICSSAADRLGHAAASASPAAEF
jgi:hypothetical protein